MANVFLAWLNRCDEGTLSGGSWLSTLPLINLQNRQVQKVARSSSASTANAQFTIDLGAARSIGVLSLIVHNLSVIGKVRITGDDAADFLTPIYQSAWIDAWPSGQIPQQLLEWEDDNFWLGTLSQNQRTGYQSPFIHLLPTPQSLRYWKVEIDDTANADGFIQIGRLFLAQGWRPGVNYAYGAELAFEDPSPIEVSLSGAEFFDIRSKFRVFRFRLQFITDTEAYNYVYELRRIAGVSGEVLLMQDSSDTTRQPMRAFVGRLRNMGTLSQEKLIAFNADFEIKELL